MKKNNNHKSNVLKILSTDQERDGGKLASNLWIGFAFLPIIFVVIIFVASFPAKTSAAANWYNNSWGYRKAIAIDHTKVSNTDQSNFPVLISLTDSDLQAHARSDGFDILFTDSTGTTKIPYEREQYTNSSGTLVAWVKVADLSHSTDTVIYLYYGNPSATDQQNSAGGVWDANFKGVWHSGDASLTAISDSTANANTGTKYGTAGPLETTGKIGKAQSYNGSDSYVSVVPSDTLSGSFTVSVWAKVSDGQNPCTVIGTRSPNESSFDFKFDIGDNIHGDIGDGNDWITTEADVDTGIFSYSADTWYQITYVVTGAGYTIYVNGNDVASGSYGESTPLLFDSNHNFYIGQVGYGEEWFNGAIDEVRISDIARSAGWIQTEYNNQNNPSAFYSLGSETIDDETAPSVPGIPHATIGAGLTSQDWTWAASSDAGSGVKQYDWRVDGGPSGTTTDTTVTANLAPGNWKFYVKAEDNNGNQSAENSSLLAILATSIQSVVVDCSVPLVQVVTPATDVSNPVIDLTPIAATVGDLVVANVNCAMHLETILPSGVVKVDIPAATEIKAPVSLWSDKIIVPPIPTSPSTALLPANSQIALAVIIGHTVAPLDITRGTRVFMSGQAGKKIGYISNNVFTEITDICTDDSQGFGDSLSADGSCKIDSGSDLVIWTKHFSDFITYTSGEGSGPSVSVEDGAVDFGYLSLGGTKDNSGDVQVITVSDGPVDLSIETTLFTDGTSFWSLGENNGDYTCQWQFSANDSDWYNFLSADPVSYPLASGATSTQNLYLKLTMPAKINGNNQYSATVTILATAP